MVNVILVSFSWAIVVSLILLLIYIICLFHKFAQFRRESRQFDNNFPLYTENYRNSFNDIEEDEDDDAEGPSDTTTLILYLPLALLDKWSSPSESKGRQKEMSREETNFFQLPSDKTYYKYSLVDETMSNDKISSKRNSLSNSKPLIYGQSFNPTGETMGPRQNTWDLIQVVRITSKSNVDNPNSNVSRNKRNPIKDISIERFMLREDGVRDEKELLI